MWNPFYSLPERPVPLLVFSTSSSPSACSSLCSAFSHVCMNILHPQFLFLWQREDASELSAHLAFQRRYITCCWTKLIPCRFPFPKHGLPWINSVVWVYELVLLTSLQRLLVRLPSNFQNGKQLPRPGAEHKCVAETSIHLKLRRERAVCRCSLWAVWDRRSETPPPSQACSHGGLQAMWEQTGCCWSSSLLLSLALGGCHYYSSQEEPNVVLVCNNLPSQCCRPVTSGGDAFRLAL